MQYLKAQGCAFDDSACEEAAAGHLHILRWLRDLDCPWNVYNVCETAAQVTVFVLQFLEVVRYSTVQFTQCHRWLNQ
jgi:hypothetical protein